MKLFTLLVAIFIVQYTSAQIKVTNFDKAALPKTIHYTGKIMECVHYKDKAGLNVLITTETGITGSGDFRDADLYAYHYDVNGNNFQLTWQVHDFVNDCGVDLVAKYIPHTFAVTDLNNNGIAEVWLMYQTACQGDVSPFTMKIIMHEGLQKFAMRGTNRVKISDKDYDGGNYTFDQAFKDGPAVFRNFAERLWTKNIASNLLW